MTDNRLKIFVAVAETGGFTAAAHRLKLSQPAVSQNVAQLEAEGFRVELMEARPRKDQPAGQRRVVRQTQAEGVCRLTWSNFKA